MDKITVSGIADSKPSMVVAVEAAGAITVGAGELIIAVGDNVKADHTVLAPGVAPVGSNQRAATALEVLREKLREAQYPNGPLAVTFVSGAPPNAEGYAVANAAAVPALTEDDAVIAYDTGFYPAGNSENIGSVIRRAAELFQEAILKLN